MRIRSFSAKQGVDWIACGRRRSGLNLTFWMLASLAYTVVALLILHIPILGEFILVLISPLWMGGAVLVMEKLGSTSGDSLPPTQGRNTNKIRSHLSAAFAVPREEIADALWRPDNLLALLELCVITLGLALVGQIIISAIAGSAILENIHLAQMGFFQAWRLVIAALVTVAVLFFLSTIFVYAIPLSLLSDLTVIGSVYFGYRAAIQNLLAYSIFTLLLLLPLVVPILAFFLSQVAGISISLLSGALFLPIMVNSMYCSFKLTFDLSS